jgi:EmrB/QacA subfamily drug resistance transporter
VAQLGLARRVNDTNLKWWTLTAACFALFMAILDNLVVNIALPTISRDLDSTATQLQWILSAYTLVFASLQITAGGLGDRLGRKRLFLFGIVLFTATSAFAATAQSTEWLITARALQGLGAAFIMPLSLSLISAAFPPQERGKALGIWSAVSVSGLALGPVVGGLIVEYMSWHWIFFLNVPIGVLAFFVTLAVVRESRDTSGTVATDIPGTVLVTGAIAALTWALIEAGARGWSDQWIVGAFAAFAVLLAGFIAVEARTERPMVPLSFFRSTTFTGANIVAFGISFLISGVAFSMTLYWQNIHGYSPVKNGLTMLPMVATMMILSPISGALVNRIGPSKLLALGTLITGGSSLLYLRTSVDGGYLDLLPGYIVMGFGMALIFAPMTTAVLNSVATEKSGVASAVNGAIRETGFAFGIALLGTIMNRVYLHEFNNASEVIGLRRNPELASLGKVLDVIGSGINFGGRVIYDHSLFPQLPAAVTAQIQAASSRAFVSGMDRAFIITAIAIVIASVLSFVLIDDEVATQVHHEATEPADAVPAPELDPISAD